MRRNPMVRSIIGAAALTLLTSSLVAAQSATPPPDKVGPTLRSSVITNALDDASVNELVENTTRQYHRALGGKMATTKRFKNGWLPEDPQLGTEAVVDAVLEVAQDEPSVIVISGGDGQANVGIAGSFDTTTFIDLGQQLPCVTRDGQPDPSGTCEGGASGLPFNYSAVEFAVEDGAYLAGVLAAAASRNDRLGIISGYAGCAECNRYVQGFVEGARSIDPDIGIELAYLADDEISGFGDPASARTFTEAFLDVFEPDVVLPVGRGATPEMVEAVCAAGKLAVGTGIDFGVKHPDLDCVLTSVTTDIERGIEDALYAFADVDTQRQPVATYDLVDDRVAVTDEWMGSRSTTLPVDTAERYKNAEAAILTGQVDTCPNDCGSPLTTGTEAEVVEEGEEASATE